jgi:hypothetical protein
MVAPTAPPEMSVSAGAPTGEAATWTSALIDRPLVLGKGSLETQVGLLLDVSEDSGAGTPHPTSLIVATQYSLTDDLAVGVGNMALCLSDCGDAPAFNSLSLDLYYRLAGGPSNELVAQPALYFSSFDPQQMALSLGVIGRMTLGGSLGLWLNPRYILSLDDAPSQLMTSVQPRLQLSPRLAVFGTVALLLQFDDAGTWMVPMGVSALYNVSPRLDVTADFTFGRVLGSEIPDPFGGTIEIDPFAFRTFRVYALYRFGA